MIKVSIPRFAIVRDASSRVPVYLQLEDQFRKAILGGILQGHSRLPASRTLAADLGISRATIVHVLENLQAEGYLESKPGSGTFVAEALPQHLPQPSKPATRSIGTSSAETKLSSIGMLAQSIRSGLEKADYRPFLPNTPAFNEFPFATWKKCWNRVMRSAHLETQGYGDPAGYAPLRRSIAEYLAINRGDHCDPDQVVITSGSHAAFALVATALANPGDKIWFEDPGPITVRNLMTALGLRVCFVGLDKDGMNIAGAAKAYPDARLAFAMPSRHHPLGVTMSLSRRLSMLKWAKQNDAWIIEDDYDSEFRYVGRSLPSMRSIDASGRVIYVGTFSPAYSPKLGLGGGVRLKVL